MECSIEINVYNRVILSLTDVLDNVIAIVINKVYVCLPKEGAQYKC